MRVTTRRGEVELPSRQDDAIPDGVIFIPFAYVEAAANGAPFLSLFTADDVRAEHVKHMPM